MKLLLLSGFNPFGISSWNLDKFYKNAYCPKKRNWRKSDVEFLMDYCTDQFGPENYIISAHSDGGTPAYHLAFNDIRCVGIHCHSAIYTKEERIRKIPLLITSNVGDLTGMHGVSNRAFEFYSLKYNNSPLLTRKSYKKTTFWGHEYYTCIPHFVSWCDRNFGWKPELC